MPYKDPERQRQASNEGKKRRRALERLNNPKPISKYYGIDPKERNKEYQREWYLKNKEVQLERVRQSNKKFRLKWKTQKYGITIDEYEKLIEAQNGICAICKFAIANSIDHDHDTSMVRGLLCKDCNLMLGFAKDNINTLLNAAEYLKKYSS